MQPKSSSDPPGSLAPGPSGSDAVLSVQDVDIGRVIDGRYRVEALLGKGAVGLVYRCRHLALDKDVAIKVLRPDYASDAEVAGRLEVEAKAASAAGSPHIVETVDFGRLPDGSAYFAMEYLEGCSLGELLDSGEALGPEEVLDLAAQIAEGLEAAHAAGIVHRDLKPDNVFLVRRGEEPRFVKILDFGIAKLARAESKLTRAGHIYGTPHYMSPEQAMGRETDWRTDVYSLGVILYELATAKVPFDADEPMAILMQHVNDEPPAMVPAAGGELVPRLEAVIRKCLQKDPELRYRSMRELRADLERLRAGVAPEAAKGGRARRSTLPPPRPTSLWNRGVTAVAALGIVASATLGYALYARDDARAAEGEGASGGDLEGSQEGDEQAISAPPHATTEEEPAAESASAEGASSEEAGKPVVLIVLPADARITQNGKDLGPMPVTVRVPEGGRAEVFVQRSGYVPRRLVLKGDKPRVVIGLVEVGNQAEDAAERAQAEAEAEAGRRSEGRREAGSEAAPGAAPGAAPADPAEARGPGAAGDTKKPDAPPSASFPEAPRGALPEALPAEPPGAAPEVPPTEPSRSPAQPAPGAEAPASPAPTPETQSPAPQASEARSPEPQSP